MKRFLWWVILAIASELAMISPALSEGRAIPDDNLAYPVLILRPDGKTGSGFYLNTGDSVYLVTAKHVLFDSMSSSPAVPKITVLSYSRDPQNTGKNVVTMDLASLARAKEVIAHTSADVAVVRIADVKANSGGEVHTLLSGVLMTDLSAGGLVWAQPAATKKYDEVLVANEVLVFGYPTSIGVQDFPQIDPTRPLIRAGIVAGLNPSKKTIVIDCPIFHGNSGGPVVEITRGFPNTQFRLIGVVSQFVPAVAMEGTYGRLVLNSGFGIVMPIDFVFEIVK